LEEEEEEEEVGEAGWFVVSFCPHLVVSCGPLPAAQEPWVYHMELCCGPAADGCHMGQRHAGSGRMQEDGAGARRQRGRLAGTAGS
jgi:hypothetical protein